MTRRNSRTPRTPHPRIIFAEPVDTCAAEVDATILVQKSILENTQS
ncbi:MAG: hypothetical protein LBC10_05800 [Deltaproteobacteria bacterium]|nr:hypothetical protein [Deltaproteobacteria bacterium]